jgi:hypothetical protein
MSATNAKARLEVRQAAISDVSAIAALVRRAYDDLPAYTFAIARPCALPAIRL